MIDHICKNCKCTHKVKESDLKRGWGQTCSKSCAASVKARKKNSNYKKFIRMSRSRNDGVSIDLSEGWDGHKR